MGRLAGGTTIDGNLALHLGNMSSITELGTIASGTWQGSPIASAYIGSHNHNGSDINAGYIGALYGGTGIATHLSTGIARVTSGTWSVGAISSADLSDVASIGMLDEAETASAIWNFVAGVSSGGSPVVAQDDIDDTPVDGATTAPISSNWAYDHANGTDPHSVYMGNNTYTEMALNGGFKIEGVSHGGDRSSRIFLKENSSTDTYGLSWNYDGNGGSFTYPSGAANDGANAAWSLRRHDANLDGVKIMSGTRASSNIAFSGVLTWSGGSSTNANTAYGWGDHAGLYAAASHSLGSHNNVSESSLTAGDLLYYNGGTWQNYAWTGATNVITLGTISTGTWQGTAIASAYIGSHNHAGSDINSGYISAVYGGTGIASHLSTGIARVTGGTWSIGALTSSDITDVDAFSQSGTYASLRAQATTKADVGLSSVENTALSTWAGSSNITTLGTISSGTVPAARVSAGTLGTGNFTVNGVVYWSGGNSSNANTAYGWGDHSLAGYLTSETDNQTLSFATSTGILTISGGNTADLGIGTADSPTFAGLTISGNGVFGSTSRTAHTTVKALAGDGYNTGFEAYGASQGTGYVYVGQSTTHGGGMYYNGDGTPAFATGESTDHITFYRTASSVKTVVFDYGYSDGIVDFKVAPTSSGVALATVNTNWSAADITSGTLAVARGGTGLTSGYNNTNWDTAYGWGDHSGLYSAAGHAHNGSDISAGYVGALYGGTGIATHLSTGVAQVSSGTWSVGNITSASITDVAAFSQSGTYASLRAQATTKADVGLSVVENTALSTWAGSANITTLGTISTGSIPASKITAGIFGTGNYTVNGTVTWSGGSSTNANTAYGWGNHASAGYAAGSHTHSYIPLAGGTITGDIVVGGSDRDNGMFGTYDSYKTQHIWGMGTAYKNHASGTDFGNLYGLAYKHTNNTTGGTMASGHQMVWVVNGTGTAALGTNIWTSGTVTASGGNSGNWNTAYGWGDHSGLYSAASHSLGSHNNVSETSLTAGDLLYYNGGTWQNYAWTGATNVTTLGTIGTGTWQGTAIASAYIGSHNHAGSDINSGYISPVYGGTGIATHLSTGIAKVSAGTWSVGAISSADLSDVASIGMLDEAETVTARWAFNGGTSGASSPFTVDSTFKVSNLNADLVDGYSVSESSTVSTIAARNSSGDINARLFRSEYDTTNATIGYIMTQVDTVSNNYMRPSTPAQLKAGLSLNNVENTALSTWAGSANITTLGTISSGTVPAARVSAGTLGTGNFTVNGVVYWSGGNSSNANTAYGWGNHASAGYADGTNEANWDTAYGWGDHASGGYAASSHNHNGSAINAGYVSAIYGGTGIATHLSTGFPRVTGGTWSVGAIASTELSDTANLIRTSDVDDTAVNGATTVPISSNWAYDHGAAANPHSTEIGDLSGVSLSSIAAGELLLWTGSGWINRTLSEANIVGTADVDDTPVNGATTAPVSSNWAYDHENDVWAHGPSVFQIHTTSNLTTSTYVGNYPITATSNGGWVMPRGGSIIGISVRGQVSVYTSSGIGYFYVRKNGVATNLFGTSHSPTGTGFYSIYATQAVGLDTFVAGDRLGVYYYTPVGSFTFDNNAICVMVQFT